MLQRARSGRGAGRGRAAQLASIRQMSGQVSRGKNASQINIKKKIPRTSLVVQWLRIRLPMQGTQVQYLVWEEFMYRGATKPVCHNY